ncbi:MAG: hypothetical protein JWP81_3199 [Ferruginibacter sp.]|nr:hypothetical protein [Ferruginibacter sp.]
MIYRKLYQACLLGAIFLASCDMDRSDEMEVGAGVKNILPPVDTMVSGQKDTIVLLNQGQAFIRGHIKPNSHQPKYTLPVWKGDTVTATIKPVEKGGNVRINQLQQPGGQFDGPFGDSVRYLVKSNGNLHFIIGENQMAGEPYTGDYVLHIKVN